MSSGDDVGLMAPVRAGSAVEEATGDRAFLQAMLDAEAALVRALGAPRHVCAAVAEAASADRFDARELALAARSGGNPAIPLAAALTAAAGDEAAEWVHRGATSQDIVDTALMLVSSRARTHILADLDRAADELARLAARHRTTPMAGRTLTQHAVPTTFGLRVAGWRQQLVHARERLAALPLPAQLGGAAGTLAALDGRVSLLGAYAAETGLDEPPVPWHALRAPVAELGAGLAVVGGALGKMAADVLVLSRTEIAEVAEVSGGGSSAMPHKSNPVRATLIASAARQLPQLAAVLLSSMAAEDERPAGAWHGEWQPLREALRVAGGAARAAVELAAGLRVDERRMRANLGATGGLIASERVVSELAGVVGRVRARELVTRAAQAVREPDTRFAGAGCAGENPARADSARADPGSHTGPPRADADHHTAPDTERRGPDTAPPHADASRHTAPPPGGPPPTRPSLADALAVLPELRGRVSSARLREWLDATAYLGAAPALTDRALSFGPYDHAHHPRPHPSSRPHRPNRPHQEAP
ncbi:3-carboxy-cis,cis-muconate cycloisomerase [Streptomyces boninensis]|uniref:3-carboxy-cis,cis-muconate cycloisomerase n=1 Tax=Streptomyces boninensis TaxID=2039455 RepID=UPI003B21BEE8